MSGNDLLSEILRVESALAALKVQRKELTGEIARRTKLVERYKLTLLEPRKDGLFDDTITPSPEVTKILDEPWN